MDLSYLLFSHLYVHILLSHALIPYFYLSTVNLLLIKPYGASDSDIRNSSDDSIDLNCSCLYCNIQLVYYSFAVLTCDYSSYSRNLYFTSLAHLIHDENNYLYCLCSPLVLELICLPKSPINSSMRQLSMPSYSFIILSFAFLGIGLLKIKSIKLPF